MDSGQEKRTYDPLDSGLESVTVDADQTDTVRRVCGRHPKIGWFTVAAHRPVPGAAWSSPCFVLPPGAAGVPIPESQMDAIHAATKRLFAVYREAFCS
jgi:hypothetical protein